jgi:putative addiction module component (TIGR02574 family)
MSGSEHDDLPVKLTEFIDCGTPLDRWLDTGSPGTIVPLMPLTPEELAEQAMDLPPESRAELAELLVESLDESELSSIDRAWAAEANRRRQEILSGTVQSIPADDAFRKVRDSLKR